MVRNATGGTFSGAGSCIIPFAATALFTMARLLHRLSALVVGSWEAIACRAVGQKSRSGCCEMATINHAVSRNTEKRVEKLLCFYLIVGIIHIRLAGRQNAAKFVGEKQRFTADRQFGRLL